jgi:hypothetical protein
MPTQCSRDRFGYEVVEERRMIAAFEGRTHDGCGLLGATDRVTSLVTRFAGWFD